MDVLADDSDDEKKIEKAEKAAERKLAGKEEEGAGGEKRGKRCCMLHHGYWKHLGMGMFSHSIPNLHPMHTAKIKERFSLICHSNLNE